MSEIETVLLKNGTKESKALVIGVMVSLRALTGQQTIQSAIGFYELVMACRDSDHKIQGNDGEILEKMGLMKDGVIHDSVRNIVLSAVVGEDLNMTIVDPC